MSITVLGPASKRRVVIQAIDHEYPIFLQIAPFFPVLKIGT